MPKEVRRRRIRSLLTRAGRVTRGIADAVHCQADAIAEIERLEERVLLSSVSGTVYADANGDGLFHGDAGMADWVAFVDSNANGRFDTGERFGRSDLSGSYTIDTTGIPDGREILLDLPEGWSQTAPSSSPTTDGADQTVTFGVHALLPIMVSGLETMVNGSQGRLSLTAAVGTVQLWHVDWGEGGRRSYSVLEGAYTTTITRDYAGAEQLFPVAIDATLPDGNTITVWTPDPDFGTDGVVKQDLLGGSEEDWLADIAVDSQDRLVGVGGVQTSSSSATRNALIARFSADGTLDTTFNSAGPTPGVVTVDNANDLDEAVRVAVLTQSPNADQIVVGGVATDATGRELVLLARFDSSGTLVPGFGSGGTVVTDLGSTDATVLFRAMAVDESQDHIIVVAADDETLRVARFVLSTGQLDSTFGGGDGITEITLPDVLDGGEPGGPAFFASRSYSVYPVAIDGNGNVAAVGYKIVITSSQTIESDYLLRLDETGELDTDFAGDGSTSFTPPMVITDVAPLGDGGMLVAGYTDGAPLDADFMVAKYDANGVLDTTFGESGVQSVDVDGRGDTGIRMRVDSLDRITLIGTTRGSGGQGQSFSATRLLEDGALDTTFGNIGILSGEVTDSFAEAMAFTVDSTGAFVISGYVQEGSGDLDSALLRMVDDGVSRAAVGVGVSIAAADPVNAPRVQTLTATITGPETISQWLIDWGDPGTPQPSAVTGAQPVFPAHTYGDFGQYTVTLYGLAKAGPIVVDQRVITVAPVGPWAELTVPAEINALEWTEVTVERKDVGGEALQELRIIWGNGATDIYTAGSAEFDELVNSGSVKLRYFYAHPANVTIRVELEGMSTTVGSDEKAKRVEIAWARPENAPIPYYKAANETDGFSDVTFIFEERNPADATDTDHEIGFYYLVDEAGGVDDNGVTLYPGDAGYQDAALAAANSQVVFQLGLDPANSADDMLDGIADGQIASTVSLASNSLIAMYVIQADTTANWRNRGTGGIPNLRAWFPYRDANEDQYGHFGELSPTPSSAATGTRRFGVESTSPFINNIDNNGVEFGFDPDCDEYIIANSDTEPLCVGGGPDGDQQQDGDNLIIIIEPTANNAPDGVSLGTSAVDENSEARVVGDLSATDPDHGEVFTYDIVADPSGWFSIDGSQLVVLQGAQLDYETYTQVQLQIRATDDDSTNPLSYTETITVTLNDANEAPILGTLPSGLSVDENTANGFEIVQLVADDPDIGIFDSVPAYSIVDGTGEGVFTINPSTGSVTVADSSRLNHELAQSYTLFVSMADSGDPSVSRVEVLDIAINDLAEAPEFADQIFNVTEHTSTGSLIGTLQPQFLDAGESATLSISSRTDTSPNLFSFDPATGEVRIIDASLLDLETGSASYTWQVLADDGTSQTTSTVTFNIVDRNEEPVLSASTFSVAEGAVEGTVVGTISAVDPDAAQTLVYGIIAGNGAFPGAFAIENDAATNQATIVVADPSQLDFELRSSFELAVRVSDDGATPERDTAIITINLTDQNDAPVITKQDFLVGVSSPTNTILGTIAAFDQDAGDSKTYSLSDPSGLFAINATTGELSLVGTPGAVGTKYSLTATVTDASLDTANSAFEVEVQMGSAAGVRPVVLDEDDRLLTTHDVSFVLPAGIEAVGLGFDDPAFGSIDWMPDAVEFSLRTATGEIVGSTLSSGSDAFVNITEGQSETAASESGVVVGGFGDLSKGAVIEVIGLTAGTPLVLSARILNNEQTDTGADTTVNLASAPTLFTTSPLPAPPQGQITPRPPLPRPQELDFGRLDDVTSGLDVSYNMLSVASEAGVFDVSIDFTANGTIGGERPIRLDYGPLLLVVSDISLPGLRLRDADGTTPEGLSYLDISAFAADADADGNSRLDLNEVLDNLPVRFERVPGEFDGDTPRFTYSLTLLGAVNTAPWFDPDEYEDSIEFDLSNPNDFTLTVRAEDREQDPISYQLRAGPSGLTIDASTGAITWPNASLVAAGEGVYPVSVVGMDSPDGAESVPLSFNLIVSDLANRPPRFDPLPPTSRAFVGIEYSFQPAVRDPNGDPMTFTGVARYQGEDRVVTIPPEDFVVDPNSGAIIWTPQVGHQGREIHVALTVTDQIADPVELNYTIMVEPDPTNYVPEIVSQPVTRIRPSSLQTPEWSFGYEVVAIDDNDQGGLTYTLSGDVPTGMEWSQSQPWVLLWTPTDADIGLTGEFVVTVEDGRGGSDSQTIQLDVVAPSPYGTATGYVFDDLNGNGIRDTPDPITRDPISIVFTVDVSGSMASDKEWPFDRTLTTGLERAGDHIQRVVDYLRSSGMGDKANIAIAGFALSAVKGNIGTINAPKTWLTPNTDADQDGIYDIDEVLDVFGGAMLPVDWYPYPYGNPYEYTDYHAAFQIAGATHYNSSTVFGTFDVGPNLNTEPVPGVTDDDRYMYIVSDNQDIPDRNGPSGPLHNWANDEGEPEWDGGWPYQEWDGFGDPFGWFSTPDINNIGWLVESNPYPGAEYESPGYVHEAFGYIRSDDDPIDFLDEPGLAGWTIYNDNNDNGVLDPWEWSTTTDGGGRYTLDLPVGTHTLRVDMPPDWRNTSDNNPIDMLVLEGQTMPGIDFGFTPEASAGSISGTVFDDQNRNGILDTGILTDNAERIIYTVDISGSADLPFGGGLSIRQSEMTALQRLTERIVQIGRGDVEISIVAYAESSHQIDLDLNWDDLDRVLSLPADYDGDQDGQFDIIQTLEQLKDRNPDGWDEGTDFEGAWGPSALPLHEGILASLHAQYGEPSDPEFHRPDPGEVNVLFLSDGFNTDGGDFMPHVEEVRDEYGAVIRAAGVGTNSNLVDLRRMDPFAQAFDNLHELTEYLLGLNGVFEEPGRSARRVFVDENGNGLFDQGEPSDTSALDGTWQIAGLAPGPHTLVLKRKPGWFATVPEDFHQIIEVHALESVTGVLFGETQASDNLPPRFGEIPTDFVGDRAISVDHREAFTLPANDPDGDSDLLTFSLIRAPEGMVINGVTGQVAWTPDSSQIGNHTAVFRVTDNLGGIGGVAIDFEVVRNRAPVIDPMPDLFMDVDAGSVSHQVVANDHEDDALTYRLVEFSEGMDIDQSGNFTFTPPGLGTYPVTFVVRDDFGGADWRSFLVRVSDDNSNVPVIDTNSRNAVEPGLEFVHQLVLNDPDGDAVTAVLLNPPLGTELIGSGSSNDPYFIQGWRLPRIFVPDGTNQEQFTVEATDSYGNKSQHTFVVSIVPETINRAPDMVAPSGLEGRRGLPAGQLLREFFTATDQDGDSVEWNLVNGPAGLKLNRHTGELSWLPSMESIGVYDNVRVYAVDAYGARSMHEFDLEVVAAPIAPYIVSSVSLEAHAGVEFDHTIEAVDPDGDSEQVRYYFVDSPRDPGDDIPAWLSIDRATGQVTASSPVAGTYPITVAAYDRDGLFDQIEHTLEVHATAPPVLESHPSIAAEASVAYSKLLDVSDPDTPTQNLTFTLKDAPNQTRPAGLVISPAGLLQWPDPSGTEAQVIVSITDGDWVVDTLFEVVVANPNAVPSLSLPSAIAAPIGTQFELDLFDDAYLSDDHKDKLGALEWRWTVTDGPAGLAIDEFGVLRWDVPDAAGTTSGVQIDVTDPWGESLPASASVDFIAVVDDVAPVVEIEFETEGQNGREPIPPGTQVTPNMPIWATVVAVDGQTSVSSLTLKVTIDNNDTWLALDANNTVRYNVPEQLGSDPINFTATATDLAGNQSLPISRPLYPATASGNHPEIEFTSLNGGADIDHVTALDGSITDEDVDDIIRYWVEIFPTDDLHNRTGESVVLGTYTGRRDGDPIAPPLRPQDYQEGQHYTLRTTATDGFNYTQLDLQGLLFIHGAEEPDDFELAFDDLTVGTAGFPISVRRIYDAEMALAGEAGDFGLGWRSNISELEFRSSGIDPDSRAFTDDTKITVRLPEGQELKFDFTPIGGGRNLRPAYTQSEDADSNRTLLAFLSVDGEEDEFLTSTSDGYRLQTGGPYNPLLTPGSEFVLQTANGLTYRINARTRELKSVEVPGLGSIEYRFENLPDGDITDVQMQSRDTEGELLAFVTVRRESGLITGVFEHDIIGDGTREIIYTYGDDRDDRILSNVTSRSGVTTSFDYVTYATGDPNDPDNPEIKRYQLSRISDPREPENQSRSSLEIIYDDEGLVTEVEDPTGYGVQLLGATLDNGDKIVAPENQPRLEVIRDGLGNVLRQIQHAALVNDESEENDSSVYYVTLFKYKDNNTNLQTHRSPTFRVVGVDNKFTQTLDPEVWETINTYDDEGRLETTTNAEDETTTFADYDDFGNARVVIDPLESVTERVYDEFGRLIETREPGSPGKVTKNIFEDGRLARVVELRDDDTEFVVSSFAYDGLGRRTSTTAADGQMDFFAYDDRGNQHLRYGIYPHPSLWPQSFDPDGDPQVRDSFRLSLTLNEYDQENRVIKTKGYELTWGELSLLEGGAFQVDDVTDTGAIDAALAELLGAPHNLAFEWETSTEYNAMGQVWKTVDRYGAETLSFYDLRGNVVQSVQTDGTNYIVTRTAFDRFGRELARTDPYFGLDELGNYDFDSNAGYSFDGSIRITHTLYDDLGRVVETRRIKPVSRDAMITVTYDGDPQVPLRDRVYDSVFFGGEPDPELALETYDDGLIADWAENRLFSREQTTYDEITGRVSSKTSELITLVYEFAPNVNALKNQVHTRYFVYDKSGRQIETREGIDLDADGNVEINDGDQDGLPDSGAELIVNKTIYDNAGRQTHAISPEGLRTKTIYDAAGRAVGTIVGEGESYAIGTSSTFDRRERKTSDTDPMQQVTVFDYDDIGRLLSVTLPTLGGAGPEYEYTYDVYGNRNGIFDPTQKKDDQLSFPGTTFTHDHANRQRSRTMPSGETERRIYDDQTLAEADLDAYFGNDDRARSTALGQLAFEVDFEGRVVERLYDNSSIGRGRQVEVRSYAQIQGLVIDAQTTAENIRDHLTANPQTPDETVTYTFDGFGRLDTTTQAFSGGRVRTESRTYNDDGTLRWIVLDENAQNISTIKYEYDNAGKITKVRSDRTRPNPAEAQDLMVEYAYDAIGRLKNVVATERFGKDLNNGTPEIELPNDIPDSETQGEITTYTYDLSGRLAETSTRPKPEKYIEARNLYDGLGRLIRVEHHNSQGQSLVSAFDYLYREDGRRIAATESFDGDVSYYAWEYDALGRLTHEAYLFDPDTGSESGYVDTFTFEFENANENETAGNIEKVERDYMVAAIDFGDHPGGEGFKEFTGTFTLDRETTSTYDANDRILTRKVDDQNDNDLDRFTEYDWGTDSTVLLGETTFEGLNDQGTVEVEKANSYTARGRLAQTDIDEGGDGQVETKTEFEYDDDGVRVKQTTTVGAGQPSVRHFVFDKRNPTGYAQVIDEFTGDGSATDDKQFTVGLDVIAQAVEAAIPNVLGANEPGIFLYDAHGSVRQLMDRFATVVKIALDKAEVSDVHKIDYEAYGEAINAAIKTAVTQLLYSGEFTDALNNNQYLRARYYDIASGRFTRVDPFAGDFANPQSLNKYLYGHADPISFTDPTGQFIFGGVGVVAVLLGSIALSQLILWGMALRNASQIHEARGEFVPVDPGLLEVHYHSVLVRGATISADEMFNRMSNLSERDLGSVRSLGNVTGEGGEIRFDMRSVFHESGQGDFGVRVVRHDPVGRSFSVRTLSGHPLAGWRHWEVTRRPNGDLLLETFSVEHAFSHGDQIKLGLGGLTEMYATWTAMLEDLAYGSGGQIVMNDPTYVIRGEQKQHILPYMQRITAP